MDRSTLKLLADNERILLFDPELSAKLAQHYKLKMAVDVECNSRTSFFMPTVTFQSETDNRETFSNPTDFTLFRKQRDAFYELLQKWEEEQILGQTEMRDAVWNLLAISSNPVNLTHMARLFVDQLQMTVDANNIRDENVLSLAGVDAAKLSRLNERLVTPTVSLVGPRASSHFPAHQAFCRDFVTTASNCADFRTHLINVLIERTLQLNALPQIALHLAPAVDVRSQVACQIKNLRLIGKFLGLILFLPYSTSNPLPLAVRQGQIELREKVSPPLDLFSIFMSSLVGGHLILTVPWLTEVLAMMDYVSPHLSTYQPILLSLLSLYFLTRPSEAPGLLRAKAVLCADTKSLFFKYEASNLEPTENETISISSPAVLLLRLSLGWLFDAPAFHGGLFFTLAEKHREIRPLKLDEGVACIVVCKRSLDSYRYLSEKLIHECCPYMPQLKFLLSGSNGSAVRHITPVRAQQPIAVPSKVDELLEWEEGFFKCNPAYMKKTVDFVSERICSLCVQHIREDIIPEIKIEAVNRFKLMENKDEIEELVEDCQKLAKERIERLVDKICKERIGAALKALWGPEISRPITFGFCEKICDKYSWNGVGHWLRINTNIPDVIRDTLTATKKKFYENCKNNLESAEDDCEQNEGSVFEKTEYDIDPSKSYVQADFESSSEDDVIEDDFTPQYVAPSVDVMKTSDALMEISTQLQCLGSRCVAPGEAVNETRVLELVSGVQQMFNQRPDTSDSNYKFIAEQILNLLLRIVMYRPDILTATVVSHACVLCKPWTNRHSGLLKRYLVRGTFETEASDQPDLAWGAFTRLLVGLISHGLFRLHQLEAQAVTLVEHTWAPDTKNQLSHCFSIVLDTVRPHFTDDAKWLQTLEWIAKTISES